MSIMENSFNLKKDLEIQIKDKVVEAFGDFKLTREMKDAASRVELKFRSEDMKDIELGNVISITYKGTGMFKGYIFSIVEKYGDLIEVVAFDQLRYLKNQHTMTIKNKTATKLIKELAAEFKLKLGEIEETSVDIAVKQIIVENQSLFEIINNALDDTMLANKKQGRIRQYILFDDFGKLTLKDQKGLKSDLVFENSNIIKFENQSSIDSQTYNKIFIYYKDDKEKKVDKYIIEDSDTQSKWGVLQKTFSVEKITKDQADEWGQKLLKYFNIPNWKFEITTLLQDPEIRGGTNIKVSLDLNNKKLQKNMVVSKVIHNFSNNEYTMDLTLLGVSENGAS